jgi:hypothetical protein
LSEHLDDYRQLMIQYYGAGIQACYRGPRLYDTDKTKQAVMDVISWYKKYFEILNSDIIHLRRADGKDWDGWMHINPHLSNKALGMLFNPLKQAITRTITIPLYYTGLTQQATVIQGGKEVQYALDRNYNVQVKIVIAPESYAWFVVK